MKMRMYNPQLAEILSTMDKEPLKPVFFKFADIVTAIRTTHEFLMLNNDRFKSLYDNEVKAGKLSSKGLEDLRADFYGVSTPYADHMRIMFKEAIETWKDREQRNAYAIVNKAPTDEQARLLEVVLKRENVSQAEIEIWAKNFGDNYACSCAFRDFAKNKGYLVIYSDFTDVEDRITEINGAVEYLHDMLAGIDKPSSTSYKYLAFYGTDENGESFEGSLAKAYTEALDSDSTFKPQTIKVELITEKEKTEEDKPEDDKTEDEKKEKA